MGVGSFLMDEIGDGSDDYGTGIQEGKFGPTHNWYGWDPNAAGTAADQAGAEGAAGHDRTALLNQAAGINNTAAGISNTVGGINSSASRIGQSAQHMDATAGSLSGLSDQLGNAPSAAALASTAAQQSNNAAAMSQAASARGANSALMMREAMQNNDARGRAAASDAATAAANEQANRFATRGQLLGAAGGIQANQAGAYGAQAGALGTAANAQGTAASAQNAAGGLISGARTGDIAQRAQDITATQGVNQLNQTHDDAAYAALAAKHSKADADSGGALDSAFSMLGMSDMRLKTDVDPLPTSSSSAPSSKPDEPEKKSDSGMSSMMSGLLASYGGGMMSDERTKTDRKKLDDDKLGSALDELLRKASGKQGGKALDTGDVSRRYDRDALDASQRAEGSQIYGESAPARVPTARFADYQPPTARFADVAPSPVPVSPPQMRAARDPGYDVAALDDAYRRERDSSQYMVSDQETKTDRKKLLDMATKPDANRENLDPVEGFSFRYKPEAAAKIGEDTGTRPGIMAQDLEKAPAGKAVIEETPLGKGLDIKRALGFSLAGVAGLDKRLQQLEAASGRGRKSRAA